MFNRINRRAATAAACVAVLALSAGCEFGHDDASRMGADDTGGPWTEPAAPPRPAQGADRAGQGFDRREDAAGRRAALPRQAVRDPVVPLRGELEDPGLAQSGEPGADMLKQWLAAQQPGAEHRRLDALIGEWEVRGWWRPAATAGIGNAAGAGRVAGATGPSSASPRYDLSGNLRARWILDGRFVHAVFRGRTLDVPYTGWHLIGYNTAMRQYQLVLMESTTTAINLFPGSVDPGTGDIVFAGRISDPAVNGSYRAVLHFGPGTVRFQGFQSGADGVEVQVSEHVYTRAAGGSK